METKLYDYDQRNLMRCVGCFRAERMSAKGLESKEMRECCFVVERDAWLRGMSGFDIGVGEFTLSSLDVLQGFSFFLQMGFTLILATLDGLVVGLLGDVIVTLSEPVDSLNMEDKHLNTLLVIESDEFINSCVKNLVPNLSESEGENKCDVLAGFTTFSNVLFNAYYDFDSGDDQSTFDEDFPKKIYSNPLFDEKIIPMKIDPHSFNVESDLIESMPNHDSLITISLKIDSLFDEFAGELALLKSIPLGIDETDCHPKKETHFAKRLLYDNSSPRPPEEIILDNSNADIESFSPSPIPNKDSDSHMEEIDLPFTLDDPMPPGIEDDYYDSGRDILILEELLDNYSLSLPANESYHFDIPSPYRPPAKPPDGNT
nr:hypothetical protein [Tanacetum cinerariifolium]